VTKANLTIAAAPGASVTVQNPGQFTVGITVENSKGGRLNGFTLTNVTVKGFLVNGVYLLGVEHFALSRVVTQHNGREGIYAVLCATGSIQNGRALGSNDGGICLSQSHDVQVTGNVVYDNVNGIEVENCTRVTVSGNNAFDNSVGILVDQLPGGQVAIPGRAVVQTSSANVVQNNQVFANNHPNSASSIDLASAEPSGAGIMIIGSDQTLVKANQVFANGFGGIIVLAGSDLLALAPAGTPPYAHDSDARPTNTLVENNTLSLNGFVAPVAGFPAPADLIWTGTGTGNHWLKNLYDTSTPAELK
jgi:hypothetical protein